MEARAMRTLEEIDRDIAISRGKKIEYWRF